MTFTNSIYILVYIDQNEIWRSEVEEENDHHPNADVYIFQPYTTTTTTTLNTSTTNHHTRYNNNEHDPSPDNSHDHFLKRSSPPPPPTTNIPSHCPNTHPTTRTTTTLDASSVPNHHRSVILSYPTIFCILIMEMAERFG